MNEILKQKLRNLLRELLSTRKLSLFVVIKREDIGLWDLVIAGDNLDNKDNLAGIGKIVNKTFDRSEIVLFSRLVLLNSDDLFVTNFKQAFNIEDGVMDIQNSQINNILIKEAFLFYSK